MNSAYGLEIDDDADALENVMRPVVNVTDEVVTFRIASVPGSKPLRYKLAPFGKPGSTVSLQQGYVLPYKGAGREMIQPIIERLTERHVAGHEGDKLPMVVSEEKAAAARAAWQRSSKAHRDTKNKKPLTVALEIDPATLIPRAASLRAPEPTKLVGEEVGQDDSIEPPHPDDEPIADGPPLGGPEPEPMPEVEVPPAPPARKGRA